MGRDVINVEPLGGYRLLLEFEGGELREIDLGLLIQFDGVFAPLHDPDFFRQVRVEPDIGTIVWPSGADLCPDVLYYHGKPAERGAGVTQPLG